MGAAAGLGIGLTLIAYMKPLSDEATTVVITALLALPALVDWATQRLNLRESRNSIRLGTGLLLGLSSSIALTMNIALRALLTVPFVMTTASILLLTNEESHDYRILPF